MVNQVQEAQSPLQDKPKEKHIKTHINKAIRDYIQRKNIKRSKGKPICLTADLSAETLEARREWQDIF